MTNEKTALFGLGRGGSFEQGWAEAGKQHAATADARNAELNQQMMNALLTYSLAGVGAGLSGTKLYNLISGLNKPKQTHTKFGPGAKTVDDDEKLAEDQGIIKTITDAIASVPGRVGKMMPAMPDMAKLDQNQQALFVPAVLGATGLGIYGGHSLMNSITEKKRKEDLKLMVEEAKKEYQRALLGKRAETLNTAFGKYAEKKASGAVSAGATAADWLLEPLRRMGVLPLYSTAVLGTGALAGKMTYDWTRERSKDKALERARKSRARLSGVAPIYVDPEQLAAIKNIAE